MYKDVPKTVAQKLVKKLLNRFIRCSLKRISLKVKEKREWVDR